MILFSIVVSLCLALAAAILAVTSDTTERLLWGSGLCSIGLGMAVELVSGGYYGILLLTVFLAADTVVYLYFRTQNLTPGREAKNRRGDFIYRVFFLWLAFCFVSLGSIALMESDSLFPAVQPESSMLALLYDRIWGPDWMLVLIPVLTLIGTVTGGFFLVRKER